MAENDEYIHSDGLRIKERCRHPQNRSTRQPASVENPSFHDRGDTTSNVGKIQLHTSVADIMEKSANSSCNLRGGQQEITDEGPLNQFTYGSSDEEEDDDDDPIIKMMRKKTTNGYRHISTSSEVVEEHLPSNRNKAKDVPLKKNPNRFFDDLEARTNTPMKYEEEERIQTTAVKNQILPDGVLSTFSKYESKMNWLKNVSPKIHNSIFTSSNENEIELQSLTKHKDGGGVDDVNVVVSSSLALGDDEAAELERIQEKMRSNNSSYILDSMRKHRHLLFILFSFILLTYGYLMMRGSTDDSVTRSRGLSLEFDVRKKLRGA